MTMEMTLEKLPPLDSCFLRWQVGIYTVEVWPKRSSRGNPEVSNETVFVKGLIGQQIVTEWNAGTYDEVISQCVNYMLTGLVFIGHRNLMRPNNRKAWNDCELFCSYLETEMKHLPSYNVYLTREELTEARKWVKGGIVGKKLQNNMLQSQISLF